MCQDSLGLSSQRAVNHHWGFGTGESTGHLGRGDVQVREAEAFYQLLHEQRLNTLTWLFIQQEGRQ